MPPSVKKKTKPEIISSSNAASQSTFLEKKSAFYVGEEKITESYVLLNKISMATCIGRPVRKGLSFLKS